MAKLSQLKQTPIRCLFVCNEDGEFTKISNQAEIEVALLEYEEDMIVKVFNPTDSQKASILEMMDENTKKDKIDLNENVVLEIIKMLTNIEVDLEGEEADKILEEPNDLLIAVNTEINTILFNIISLQFKNIKNMTKLPPELLKATIEKAGNNKDNVKKKTEKKQRKTAK